VFGPPVYVRHEVVHNKYVVAEMEKRGTHFVEELDEVPNGALVIFSAHGVSQAVRIEAESRNLKVFDATCPLVTKVHMEVVRYSSQGSECILIGHAGHPEVEGTMGQFDESKDGKMYLVESLHDIALLQVDNPEELYYVTQTTLSVDDTAIIISALRERFPSIKGPRKEDICYATQNRQDAVKDLVKQSEAVVVVGAANSSNSNRLCELAKRLGVASYLINDASELQREWLTGIERIGVTAGASAPEILINQVIERLQEWGGTGPEELEGKREDIVFVLPKELRLTPIS